MSSRLIKDQQKSMDKYFDKKIDRLLKAQETALMSAFKEKVTELAATIVSLQSEVERQKIVIEALQNPHPPDEAKSNPPTSREMGPSLGRPPTAAEIENVDREDSESDTFSVICFKNSGQQEMLNQTNMKMEVSPNCSDQNGADDMEVFLREVIGKGQIFENFNNDQVGCPSISENEGSSSSNFCESVITTGHHHDLITLDSDNDDLIILDDNADDDLVILDDNEDDDLIILDDNEDDDDDEKGVKVKLKELRILLTPLKIEDLTPKNRSHFVTLKERKKVAHTTQKPSSSSLQPPASVADENKIVPKKRSKITAIPPKNRLVCKFCKKSFGHRHFVMIHERIHTGEKPYACSWKNCQKRFTQRSQQQQHERTHTGDKPYACSWKKCRKWFRQLSQVQQHERIHRNDRPYKCQKCSAKFVQQCHLDSHRLIHTGAKPFSCPHCCKTGPASFTQKSALMAHLRRYHQGK